MAFRIFEDAERHVGHHGPRRHDAAAERLRLVERRGDVRRLDVEGHPRACAGERLTDAARNSTSLSCVGDAVVDRLDHVERPAEKIAVELLQSCAVLAEHIEPHHRVSHRCLLDERQNSDALLTALWQER